MAIVLIGFMGAGKSTAAAELAEALETTALDSDTLLAERIGHPVAQEFALRGEASFRAQEQELVLDLLGQSGPEEVIALGGGSVLSARVREALRSHLTVLLEIDAQGAWERVQGEQGAQDAAVRPLAADRGAFGELHAARQGLYEELADVVLEGLPPGGVARAADALRALHAAPAPPGTRMLWARSASGEYPVFVGRGLLSADAGSALSALWPLARPRSRSFCVTDRNVQALYGERLGEAAATIAIEPGEAHKTLAGAEQVWRALAEAGATRADHVVALGGGVVGDLAGFCAGTYQRGLSVVQVPTTLVAQVDSAYGGKTGVDLPQAKNYVGVYHQPSAVFTDPAVLETLPGAELAAGWVEVLKTALIAGGELWERVAGGGETDDWTILQCVRTKLATVAADERDGGRRQVLNLGHTVGHGIEAATGYARYRHGEAVGLGLLAALRLSGQEQLRSQVRELVSARGLPVALEGVDVEAVMQAIGADKKRLSGSVPFVLVRAPGEIDFGCELPDTDVRAAIAELSP